MVRLTQAAIDKIKSLAPLDLTDQSTAPGKQALRVGVVGGGCSGFSYAMQFEPPKAPRDGDTVLKYGDLTVFVDQMSAMYLDEVEIDYVEGLQSGFKFNNPNVKRTCGCGQSFSV